MTPVDWIVVVGYFVVVLGAGIANAPYFRKHKQAKQETAQDYFLAERSTVWWMVGCAFFASNIGSDTLVGLTGAAAVCGMSVAVFDWGSPLCFLVLAFIFLPFYLSTKIFTLPEFIKLRFGNRLRMYLSYLTLILYTIRIAASLYAGQIVLEVLIGWNKEFSLVVLVAMTGSYTVIGGLESVIITEVIQTVILVVTSFILLGLALHKVGGVSNMRDTLGDHWFTLFQTGKDFDVKEYEYPWYGLVFGYPFLALFFHCTDQEMVQRALSSKTLQHGQAGCLMGGFLKFIPPFAYVIPGIIARILDTTEGWNELGCDDGLEGSCSKGDHAFPALVKHLMPEGLKGLMLASMLAALMSSLAALFNSSATVFTMDIWVQLTQSPHSENSSQQKPHRVSLVTVGRCASCAACILGMLWVPLLHLLSNTMYTAVQMFQAAVAPPIVVIFFAALFSESVSERDATIALGVGHFVALILLVLHAFNLGVRGSAEGVNNFLLSALFSALATFITLIISVPFSPPPPREKLDGLTWKYRSPLGTRALVTPEMDFGDYGGVTSEVDQPKPSAAEQLGLEVKDRKTSIVINVVSVFIIGGVIGLFAAFK